MTTPPLSPQLLEFQSFLERFQKNTNSSATSQTSFLESLRFNFSFTQMPDFESIHKIFTSINEARPFAFKTKWLNEEIILLVWTVFHLINAKPCEGPECFSSEDWEAISRLFQDRTAKQCMFKFLNLLRSNPIKKDNRWTSTEDAVLFELANKYQEKHMKFKWTRIAIELYERTQLKKIRMGKHCRERWNNHLNPGLNKGKWTLEEDLFLLRGVVQKGRKWARISRMLQGRNEYSVKNRFYFLIKKQGISQGSRNFLPDLKAFIKSLQKRIEPKEAVFRQQQNGKYILEEEKKQVVNEEEEDFVHQKSIQTKIEILGNSNQSTLPKEPHTQTSLHRHERKCESEMVTEVIEDNRTLKQEEPMDLRVLSANQNLASNPSINNEISNANSALSLEERRRTEMMLMLGNYWNSLTAATRFNGLFGLTAFEMSMAAMRQQQLQMAWTKSLFESMGTNQK